MAFFGAAEFFVDSYQYKNSCKAERLKFLKRRAGLLVEKELKAFNYLAICIKDTMTICPQVHLLQIFDFDKQELLKLAATVVDIPREKEDEGNMLIEQDNLSFETNKERGIRLVRDSWSKFGIGDKSVDFLVCDRKTFEILFAIEIDGDSHGTAEVESTVVDIERQKKWDSVKTNLFNAAKIPLLRVKNSDLAVLPENTSEGKADALKIFNDALEVWRQSEKG